MSHEHYSARTHPEFVVLELGSGFGALIIHTEPDLVGLEVEISPAGDDERRSHKEVLERDAGGRPDYTAVFDRLPAGEYTLWVRDVAWERHVKVHDGRIAELDWHEEVDAA